MLPVKKKSKTRTRTKRAHHALTRVNLAACPKCGKPKRPHAACGICGYVSSKVSLPVTEEEA
ncbi:MAG: 50S ribosomal protein L32 [Planctomycetes bacterium]|nr:50S ribosomal protein L32 [Planctomycetota bacterium]MBI3833046.1 50S ribosomal protein L32 [Planctomycetota bacterium]